MKYGNFPHIKTSDSLSLSPIDMEPVLRSYGDQIQSFSWLTFEVSRAPTANIQTETLHDLGKMYE